MLYAARVSTHGDQFSDQHTSTYGSSDPAGGGAYGASAEQTTLLSGVQSEPAEPEGGAAGTRWHGGLDFGLLVLRILLGGTMLGHGLQKLFGLFDGPGISGFAGALESAFGFTSQTTLLSWITAVTETVSGALLVLGLFTPLAAAGILGVAASVVYLKFGGGFFSRQGFEYELLLAGAAFTLLFTGAGRIAVDVNTPWRRKPMPFAVFGVLLAAAASVLVLVLFR